MLQPLLVAPSPGTSGLYTLLAGELRLGALMRLGWTEARRRVLDVGPTRAIIAEIRHAEEFAPLPLTRPERGDLNEDIDEWKIERGLATRRR